ncbi:IolE Sugar phosphate isomerases/epimerases [Candidatus Pelagibacterales bacterium]
MIYKLGFMQGRLVEPEGLSLVQSFPENKWEAEMKIAKKEGFKIMEWTINTESIKKNPVFNGDLKNVIKSIKNYQIKVISITLDFFMEKPFFKKKNKTKNKIIADLKKIILNGQRIGIKYYIFPLVDNSKITTSAEENILVNGIKQIAKILKRNSQILFETDYPPNKVINFIKKFKSKKVGINYDTGNSASLGYNFEDEMKYIKYIKNIHIKDRILNGNTVRLGTGSWNYKKFFKLIKRNYKGNFILQTARSKSKEHIKEININKKFFENEYK